MLTRPAARQKICKRCGAADPYGGRVPASTFRLRQRRQVVTYQAGTPKIPNLVGRALVGDQGVYV